MVMCRAMLSAVRGFKSRKLAPALSVTVDSFELWTQAKMTDFELDVPLRMSMISSSAPGASMSTKTPSNLRRLRLSRADSAPGDKLDLAPYFFTPPEMAVRVAQALDTRPNASGKRELMAFEIRTAI